MQRDFAQRFHGAEFAYQCRNAAAARLPNPSPRGGLCPNIGFMTAVIPGLAAGANPEPMNTVARPYGSAAVRAV